MAGDQEDVAGGDGVSIESVAREMVEGRWEPFERDLSATSHLTWYRYSICGGAPAPMADGHAPDCPWLALQAALQAEAAPS